MESKRWMVAVAAMVVVERGLERGRERRRAREWERESLLLCCAAGQGTSATQHPIAPFKAINPDPINIIQIE